MGLQCGNPTAIANLQEGEVVVDLGAGGGLDVFLASKKVGATGKAIGVDMTPKMVAKARATAKRTGKSNVEFRLGEIEHLPIADNTADVIISNCVLNLVGDKAQACREMFRIAKSGGRVAVSDVLLKVEQLPDALRNSIDALVCCVAGAVPHAEFARMLTEAG
jgi:arsenite methyltransferase